MDNENSFQNQDIASRNPLQTAVTETATPSAKKLILPSDPKIKLLFVLGAIVAVLLVVSIFVSIFRKSPSGPKVSPTPIPTIVPLPTDIVNDKTPKNIKIKFDQIDKNTRTDINFNPPQTDPDIGL